MRSNGLLKWLLVPLVFVVLFIGLKMISSGQKNNPGFHETPKLTAEEMKALGIEGDTPRDTVATLVGQVKQMRSELQAQLKENTTHKAEIERLRQLEREIEQRVHSTLSAEQERLRQARHQTANEQQRTKTLIDDLQRRLENLGKSSTQPDLPVGLGLERAEKDPIFWIEPQDAKPQDARSGLAQASVFPTSFRRGEEPQSLYAGEKIRHESYGQGSDKTELQPVYTVPANSTLIGSVAMTALIGRIPVDGTVTDPYPFKVLVGPDNLTANGIELPGVAGAVMSGNASGDWTLSCVRGQIHTITFVFTDGTIRTVPPPSSGSRQNNRGGNREGLGWISDPFGIPRVSGERKSNAAQYLGTQALITAAGAGAASLLKDDSGTFNYANSDGTVTSVGISGNEAMNQILMGGVRDMSKWVNRLYGEAFAAVYVQPGAAVAIHIDEEVAIDFDEAGRKVDHSLGDSHAQELD